MASTPEPSSWDVVRESLHHLKLDQTELTGVERETLAMADRQSWAIYTGAVASSVGLAFLLPRALPPGWIFGKGALFLGTQYAGFSVGSELSSKWVERQCLALDGSLLAATLVQCRDELRNELRTKRYDVPSDIFKGKAKR